MPRTSDPDPKRASGWEGMGQGWTMLAELATAIALWGGIGYGLDRLLGTGPVLFAVGMVVGYAAGAYILYLRGSGRLDARTRKEDPNS